MYRWMKPSIFWRINRSTTTGLTTLITWTSAETTERCYKRSAIPVQRKPVRTDRQRRNGTAIRSAQGKRVQLTEKHLQVRVSAGFSTWPFRRHWLTYNSKWRPSFHSLQDEDSHRQSVTIHWYGDHQNRSPSWNLCLERGKKKRTKGFSSTAKVMLIAGTNCHLKKNRSCKVFVVYTIFLFGRMQQLERDIFETKISWETHRLIDHQQFPV